MKGYVSYPRTDSEVYPPTLDLNEILNELKNSKSYEKAANSILSKPLHPTKGKEAKDHPPIHPVKLPSEKLNPQEARIFDLITKRFLATLSDESEEETVTIKFDIGGNESPEFLWFKRSPFSISSYYECKGRRLDSSYR